MVQSGIVAREEPIKSKPSKKRTARQANLDNVAAIGIEPKRTNRQKAINLATQKELK